MLYIRNDEGREQPYPNTSVRRMPSEYEKWERLQARRQARRDALAIAAVAVCAVVLAWFTWA